MDNKTSEYRGKGVEFLRAMIPIYRPTWPPTLKLRRHKDFLTMFRRNTESVDQYASKFLNAKRELEWNNVTKTPAELRELFILSLGADFTSLHNTMSSLPDGWETDNIEELTTLARKFLATVVSNRERNKIQREMAKKENEGDDKNSGTSTNQNIGLATGTKTDIGKSGKEKEPWQ